MKGAMHDSGVAIYRKGVVLKSCAIYLYYPTVYIKKTKWRNRAISQAE
jgi:hypothetical protein